MKRVIFKICTIALLLNGCGTSDVQDWIDDTKCSLGIDKCDDKKSDNNTSADNTSNNEQNSSNNGMDNNQTENNQSNTNQENSQNSTTTESNSEITIDPNACVENFDSLEDDNNQPEGVSKNGITFTSNTNPASVKLIFYYKAQKESDDGGDNVLGQYSDENGEIKFLLSIDDIYYEDNSNEPNFYVLRTDNDRCYKGSFPKNDKTPPSYSLKEVSNK